MNEVRMSFEWMYPKAPPAVEKQYLAWKKWELARKVLRVFLGVITLGIYTLCTAVWKKIKAKWINRAFMPSLFGPKPAFHPHSFSVPTIDGISLNARVIHPEAPSKKWVVFFCPNAGLHEDYGYEDIPGVSELGANLFLFNYRACGNSEGELTNPKRELLYDGVAAVQYLKEVRGVAEEDILLYGHSQGGGVSVVTAAQYEGVKVIPDRSYASVASVVGAFGSCLAKWITKPTSYNVDPMKYWMKIPRERKGIVFHKKDELMHYEKASLYYADKAKTKKMNPEACVQKEGGTSCCPNKGLLDGYKPRRVKLTADYGNYHCYQIGGGERAMITEMAKLLFNMV